MAPVHRGRVKYYGSQWGMLSRAFCDWAAKASPREAGYSTLKMTFAPDELLMQQMIMASPFRDTLVNDNKRFVRFGGRRIPACSGWPTWTRWTIRAPCSPASSIRPSIPRSSPR